MDKMTKTLRDFIALQVKAAFDDRDTIIEAAVDLLFDDSHDVVLLRNKAIQLTDELLAQHYETQKAWTHETDCDRLDEAFAELDRNGIIARQNFTCCQTCGHSEIGSEIDDTMEHRPVSGYVFYHEQDTEHVAEHNTLFLAYGSIDGTEDNSVAIGHEVVAALKRAGLSVEWNGMIQKRICIRDIQWQRRRLPESLLLSSNGA
jgi:hypothetical protein